MTTDMIQNALRLKELDKLIIKAIASWDVEQLSKYLVEFNDSKKRIRSYALEHPLLNLNEIDDPNARLMIQKIMSGEQLAVEKAMSGSTIAEFLRGELDESEIEDFGSDLFYSWFSHYDYLEGLYEIGTLTLSCGKIPTNLSAFVDEARHCYTFHQWNAVFSLCRTILEVCIRDIAIACNILSADSRNIRQIESRNLDLYSLINQLCDQFTGFDAIRNQLHQVRRKTNSIIHGTRLVKKAEAKELLKETLLAIHELYELEATRRSGA